MRNALRPTSQIWSLARYSRSWPALSPPLRQTRPLQEVRDSALILLYPPSLHSLCRGQGPSCPFATAAITTTAYATRCAATLGNAKTATTLFSDTAARYWSVLDDLCRAIDTGDTSIGLPPYNGGLFERDRTSILTRVRLNDAVMANVIDALSFESAPEGRRYINYPRPKRAATRFDLRTAPRTRGDPRRPWRRHPSQRLSPEKDQAATTPQTISSASSSTRRLTR